MNDTIDLKEKVAAILTKLNLSEDEAMVLFSHFTKCYIVENGCLKINVSANTEWEGDSKYGTLNIHASLELDGEEVLASDDYCSIGL